MSPRFNSIHHIFKRSVTVITPPLLVLVFAYTGLSKLQARERFQVVLESFPGIGAFGFPISVALPLIELVAAILILIPVTRLLGLWSTLVLLTGFTIYLGGLVVFASHRPCSCGRVLESLSWTAHLVLNITMLLLNALFIHYNKNALRNNRDSRKPVEKSRQHLLNKPF